MKDLALTEFWNKHGKNGTPNHVIIDAGDNNDDLKINNVSISNDPAWDSFWNKHGGNGVPEQYKPPIKTKLPKVNIDLTDSVSNNDISGLSPTDRIQAKKQITIKNKSIQEQEKLAIKANYRLNNEFDTLDNDEIMKLNDVMINTAKQIMGDRYYYQLSSDEKNRLNKIGFGSSKVDMLVHPTSISDNKKVGKPIKEQDPTIQVSDNMKETLYNVLPGVAKLTEPKVLPIAENYNAKSQAKLAWNIGQAQKIKIQAGIAYMENDDEKGDRLTKKANQMMKNVNPEKLQTYDPRVIAEASNMEKALNSKYLIGSQLPSLPSSISAMTTPLAIQAAGHALSAGSSLIPLAGPGVATGIKGATTVAAGYKGREIESKMEGGDAYNTSYELLINKGYNEEDAKKYAKQVGKLVRDQNMKLIGSDIAQNAIAFMVPGGKGLIKIPIGAGKMVGNMYLEGIEELTQQIIQENASQGKDTHIIKEVGSKIAHPETQTYEEREAKFAGSLMGIPFTGGGIAIQAISDKIDAKKRAKGIAEIETVPAVTENVPSAPLNQEVTSEITPNTEPAFVHHLSSPILEMEQPINTQQEGTIADTSTPTQDLVFNYINGGMDKLQAWDQLGVDRGGEQGIHPQEFGNLYDALVEMKESSPEVIETASSQESNLQQQVHNVKEEAGQIAPGAVGPEQAVMPQGQAASNQPEAAPVSLDTTVTPQESTQEHNNLGDVETEVLPEVYDTKELTQAQPEQTEQVEQVEYEKGDMVTWENHKGITMVGQVVDLNDKGIEVITNTGSNFKEMGYTMENPRILVDKSKLRKIETEKVNKINKQIGTSKNPIVEELAGKQAKQQAIQQIKQQEEKESTSTNEMNTPIVQKIIEQRFKIKLPDNSYEVSNVNEETNPELKIVKKWSELMKRKLTIVKPIHNDADNFNGFVTSDGIHIVLNEKSDNPLHITVAHELVHDIKRNNPKLYEKLEDAVLGGIGYKKGGIRKWYADKKYGTIEEWDKMLNDTDALDFYVEEFIADCMMEAASAKTFYKDLVKKSISTAKEFLKAIDDIISKLKKIPISKEYSVKPYIEHWGVIRNACNDALVEYVESKLNIPVPEVNEIVKETEVKESIIKVKSTSENEKSIQKTEKKESTPISQEKKEIEKPISVSKEEKKSIPTPKVKNPEIIKKKEDLSDQELLDNWTKAIDNKEVHLAKMLKDEMDKRANRVKEAKSTTKKTKVSDEEINKLEKSHNWVSHEEERELGGAAQAGDKEALEKLLLAYNDLIYKIANKYMMNKHDLSLDDLVQEGRISFINVLLKPKKNGDMKYNPDYVNENGENPRLGTIAKWWIERDIKRYMNEYGSMVNSSEHKKIDYSLYLKAARTISDRENRVGTLEEIVEVMRENNPNRFSKLDVEKLEDIIKSQRELTSLSTSVGEDGYELTDFIANEVETDPYHKLHMDRLTELLGEAMNDLSETERNVIYLRYFYDEKPTIRKEGVVPLSKIAKLMGLSKSRVEQLHNRAMEKLRESKQLEGMSVDFSIKQVIETLAQDHEALFSIKVTKGGFIQSTENMLYDDDIFDKEVLSLITNDEGVNYTKQTMDGWREFAQNEIDKGIDKAVRKFKGMNDRNSEPGQKTALGVALRKALLDEGRRLHEEGDYASSVRTITLLKDIVIDMSTELSRKGQDIAAAALANKFDASSVISNLERENEKIFEKSSPFFKKRINKLAKNVTEEMNKINGEKIDQVLDELSNEIEKIETGEVKKTVPSETIKVTMAKIEEHLNNPKNDEGPVSKVVKMMNDLFKGWFSTKSNRPRPNKTYTMDIVSRYLNNDPLVEDKWEEIRKMLRYEYGEDFPTSMDFFNYYLTRPTTDSAMNKSVHETIRMLGINLNNIVTKQDINEISLKIMEVMTKKTDDGLPNPQMWRPAIYARIKYLAEQNKEHATERLAKRIVGMAKTSIEGPKNREENKIRDMMNMITKIARETLPKTKSMPRDPMEMVSQALSNYRDYQRMWMGAEKEIIEKYPEMKEEIEILQQFFNRPINDVIANNQLERVVRKGLSDNNLKIEDIVKKHYTEQTLAIQSLADKLIEQAGLKEEDADKLANIIQRRFEELVQDKKRRILDAMLNDANNKKVRKNRETLVERLCRYSNIGAFDERQYRQIICDMLGIPIITPQMCSTITKLCDDIQTSEYRMEPSLNGNYQVRWSTTYKYVLMLKDENGEFQEVGRYNTLDEAKDHSPKETEWRGWSEIIGSDIKNERIMMLRALLSYYKNPTILKKISTIQTMGMLLALPTAIRNVSGNEMNYWSKRVTKLISIPLDIASSKLTGSDRKICLSPNNDWISYWTGLKFGVRAAYRGWTPRGVDGQYELGFGPTFKNKRNFYRIIGEEIDNPTGVISNVNGFFEQALSYAETAMRISLLGMDQASFTRAYENRLAEIAKLHCINKGEKITKENLEKYMKNIDDNLIEQCNEFAKKMTYQNDTKLTKLASRGKYYMNLTLDFGLGDVLTKFTKVPINLTQLAFEYSPFGFLKGLFELSRPYLPERLGGREYDKRAVIEAFSDALVGTLGFTGFGIWMGSLGILTGKEDDDPRKKKYNRSLGGGLYKFNISAFNRYFSSLFNKDACEWKDGDWVIGYSWAEPAATSVAMGVAMNKTWKDYKRQQLVGSKEEPWKFGVAAMTVMEEGAGVIFDRSVFEGMMSLFESAPGETFTGARFISNAIGAFYTEGPATFIPSVVRECRVYEDPYMRVTWSEDPTTKMLNKIKDKIPILSETLPMQTDYLGNPRERNVGMHNSITSSFISPMYINKVKLPDTRSERIINDIYNESNNALALPASMNKNINIRGNKVKLTDTEMDKLIKLRGKEINERVQRANMFNNDDAPIDVKVKLLHNIYKESGAKARRLILPEVKKNHNIE